MHSNITYGLIGYPVGHSFSASYFNEKFANEHLNDKYEAFSLPDIGDFQKIISANPELKGLNVTSPWKELVLQYADEMSPTVKRLNAANTLHISYRNGRTFIKAFNTDVEGFRLSLEHTMLASGIAVERALVLGTGGASRAVLEALRQIKIPADTVSRDPARGISYRDLSPARMRDYQLIVNATPVGMAAMRGECPPIPYEGIDEHVICFDLIYNPEETEFLRRAKARGAAVKNGLEMLRLQADASWRIWNQRESDIV